MRKIKRRDARERLGEREREREEQREIEREKKREKERERDVYMYLSHNDIVGIDVSDFDTRRSQSGFQSLVSCALMTIRERERERDGERERER
jgi:hypothetical protein